MTRQTRLFVLGASGLLVLGLCTGLFAYINREAALAVAVDGPVELRYVPAKRAAPVRSVGAKP